MNELLDNLQHDSDIERMAEPVPAEPTRPNGGIFAALIAAGIGCARGTSAATCALPGQAGVSTAGRIRR